MFPPQFRKAINQIQIYWNEHFSQKKLFPIKISPRKIWRRINNLYQIPEEWELFIRNSRNYSSEYSSLDDPLSPSSFLLGSECVSQNIIANYGTKCTHPFLLRWSVKWKRCEAKFLPFYSKIRHNSKNIVLRRQALFEDFYFTF